MKVLDLQCGQGHTFECWFGSEADFEQQRERGLVQCPHCNSDAVHKLPSAPRLNLGHHHDTPAPSSARGAASEDVAAARLQALRAEFMRRARAAVASAEDVGERFAEEARRIHHGEAEDRSIRGLATPEETRALIDDGIDVMPLPDALKQPLH